MEDRPESSEFKWNEPERLAFAVLSGCFATVGLVGGVMGIKGALSDNSFFGRLFWGWWLLAGCIGVIFLIVARIRVRVTATDEGLIVLRSPMRRQVFMWEEIRSFRVSQGRDETCPYRKVVVCLHSGKTRTLAKSAPDGFGGREKFKWQNSSKARGEADPWQGRRSQADDLFDWLRSVSLPYLPGVR